MSHDFKNFPELTNSQLQLYYFESPHKQIMEDFTAVVVKVHDGDTITVSWSERDFDFPIRLADISAPELNQEGGHEAQSWLEKRILGETVDIILSSKRVEKWGRILGTIKHHGLDVAQEEIQRGLATTWEDRKTGIIPKLKPI
jgi:endonuclease YncB( thermonuclease family)